jgi:HEAT repeat protein
LLIKKTFKNINFNILKYLLSFILPKNLFYISIFALITGFGVILFLSTSHKKLSDNVVENGNPQPENIEEIEVENDKNKKDPIINSLTLTQQLEALQSLNIISAKEDREKLISLFSSADFEIRIAALKLVAEKVEKGHPEVVSSLSELLLDPDYLVRGFAVSSLVAYSGEEARILLEDHQKTEASEVVKSAIDRALLKINTSK